LPQLCQSADWPLLAVCGHHEFHGQCSIYRWELFKMAVTRIVANLTAPDPMGLAKFYEEVFELDLPFDMGWIAFLSKETTQKIELHTASEGGSGTELPVISIGVDDLDATEAAVRAAGAEVVYGPATEDWGLRRFFSRSSRQSRECCRQLKAVGGLDANRQAIHII
jgi:predicted enzyme related to lactoylglutathione lyase